MPDKPERLGVLHTRMPPLDVLVFTPIDDVDWKFLVQFAPKRPVKKEPKASQKSAPAAGASGAGPSDTGGEDDPFAALLQQAEAAKTTSRKPSSRANRGSKFQVAFGASAVHLGQVVKATQPPRKVEVGTCGFEFNVGRTCIACIRSTRPFRETGPIHAAFGSWDQWTKGKNAGPSGGSGGGGGGGARAPGKVGAAGGIKNEDGEIIFPEDDDMMGKPVKVRAALFDRETYYPTVIPFKHVDQPHDPNVATDAGLPVDLSTQVPEEGPVADELGLTGATPDGVVAMLQLPPLLPSVSLFEAAERAALEAPTSDNQQLPEGTKPKPKFQRGPEVLKALPDGRIGTVQVMKSGKVYMKIGSARYLMRPGVEHSHHTELYIINTTTTDMVMVGEDCPTASACLDLEALLLSES